MKKKTTYLVAADRKEFLQKLDAPVARVILRLVGDMIATHAVPGAHADVLGKHIQDISDAKVCRNTGEHAIDEVTSIPFEGLVTTHRCGGVLNR